MPENARAREAARRPRLSQRRKELGLTQEDLADLLGVERTTVVRWERGETEPLPWVRPKLARALRVPPSRLQELLAVTPSGRSPAAPVPRQLPAAVAAFTGRTRELEALTRILDERGADRPGTVVISAIGGTAGVGKTALAVQWAHGAIERFPDGQLYVNLRGYDPDRPMPPGEVLAGFLRALGVAGQDIPPEEDERAARYRSLLAGKQILVVLDNAGSVDQVRSLLPGSATCTVLVTSRDALAGLIARDGAVRVDLDLLPAPDAAGLLRTLIGARAEAEPEAVTALAAACCRLPLALRVAAELAGARPGAALAELAAELTDEQRRLDLLGAGGDPRTSVRSVFSWSYRHLDGGTARSFRLASLHPGADFDPYALAALTGTPLDQARRMLDALARAHLIQPAGAGRYGMHDLLRGYARELATEADGPDGQRAALTRLFDHYLYTAANAMDVLFPAERHRRPRVPAPSSPAPPLADTDTARAWLDTERPNLVSCATHAAGHEWPGHAITLGATVFRYLEQGGHAAEADVIHGHAVTAAQRAGDRRAEAGALNALGVGLLRQCRYQQALSTLRRALALFREAGDPTGEARALANIAYIHSHQGRYPESIACRELATRIFRETGDLAAVARQLGNLGILDERQGRYEQAVQRYQENLASARQRADTSGECGALINLGSVLLRQGHLRDAGDHLYRALDLAQAIGSRTHLLAALTTAGQLCLRQGNIEDATRHAQRGLTLSVEIGDLASQSTAYLLLGAVALAAAQPGDARACYAEALDLATQIGDKYLQARADDGLGGACHACGETGQARTHWQRALATFTELGAPETARVGARLDATATPPT